MEQASPKIKRVHYICYVKRRLAGTLDYVTPTMDV